VRVKDVGIGTISLNDTLKNKNRFMLLNKRNFKLMVNQWSASLSNADVHFAPAEQLSV